MEPVGKPDTTKLTMAVCILMLFPISLSMYGIYGFVNSSGPNSHESLYFVGFMGLLSLVVFVPYTVILLINWRHLKIGYSALAITPFLVMAAMYKYALNNGLPM